MKISIVRSGGFGGISMPAKVMETNDEEVKELVKEALAAPNSAGGEPVVDGFSYDITIEESGEATKTIRVKDQDPHLNVQKLIDHVLD